MSLPNQKQQKEAAENYQRIRDEIERERVLPWTSASAFEIGPFVVNPASLRSIADLTIAENAFLKNESPTEGDLVAYIWRHHPDYAPDADHSEFLKEFAAIDDTAQSIKDAVKHLNAAFEETPMSARFGETQTKNSLPPIPPIASLCHEYGNAYGVDPREVADIDLRIVFQCCRAIRMSQSDVTYSEPEKLRKAKSEFLKTYA
jgi:hypothetical protein